MFSLELTFHDGVSPSETILLRRAQAIIGSSEHAHVVVESANGSDVRITRGIGRSFYMQPIRRPSYSERGPALMEGEYQMAGEFPLGEVTTYITALDVDLFPLPNEAVEQSALRVLRMATRVPSPKFPALMILGPVPTTVSFSQAEPIYIGRSRKCLLRLDSSSISAEHARVGIDTEGSAWIEDLGSTNGTFIGRDRVSGRRKLKPSERVRLGGEFELMVLLSEREQSILTGVEQSEATDRRSYPCVIASSELIRPSYLPLDVGKAVVVGRDPGVEIVANAPHVSRHHAELVLLQRGGFQITDTSSNGTFINGEELERGVPLHLPPEKCVIDLKDGIELTVLFSESRSASAPVHGALHRGLLQKRDRGDAPMTDEDESLSVFQRLAKRSDNQADLRDKFPNDRDRQEIPPNADTPFIGVETSRLEREELTFYDEQMPLAHPEGKGVRLLTGLLIVGFVVVMAVFVIIFSRGSGG